MTAGKTGPKAFSMMKCLEKHGIEFGMLWGPTSYKRPWCDYALDNDCFHNSHKQNWWMAEGECKWLKMLDKISTCELKPIFATLPDVVGDWNATVDLSCKYITELRSRGIRPAIVMQDGSSCESAANTGVDVFFLGGSVKWKWSNADQVADWCRRNKTYLHIGQVNGISKTARCIELGIQSCDGSGLARFPDAMVPLTIKAFDKSHQERMVFQ
jgi:hypothetical protein